MPGRERRAGIEELERKLFSRRTLLRGALGLTAGAMLAACGGDDDDDDGGSPTATPAGDDPTATTAGSSGSGETRTVEHAMGTTEVPANPERVVVLDMGEMDMALALGVQPVGAALYTLDQEFAGYLQDRLDEYTRVGTVTEPDLEAVAALEPDLIISNKLRHEAIYDTLSQIAPTVFAESLGTAWKESFQLVAEALGKTAEHEQVMADYAAKIEEFQSAMGERLAETHVTVVRSMPDQLRLYMKDSFIGRVIEDSGLPRPPVQDQEIFMEEISAERIRDLEADVIFTLYYNPGQGETLSALTENPLWKQLAAVQAGQVYEMDDAVWGTGLGPLAAIQVIDDLTATLVDGAVDSTVWAPEGGDEAGAPSGSAFPVTFEHKHGSTTLEAAPERIVLVGLVEQDALLALGVVPVATREWYGEKPGAIFPWAQDLLGDAEPPVVLDAAELDFELIASLKPDVIVGLYAGVTAEEYETLSQIAPTIAQPPEYVDWGIPWQELTLKLGQIVGKAREAEELVDGVEAVFEEARAAHPEFDGARAVVASPYGLPENYWVYSSQDVRGRILTSLGFEVPEVFDEMAGEEFGATVSVEQLDLIGDLDAAIWVSDSGPFEGVELYEALPLVREGRAIYYGEGNPVYDALNFGTALSLPFAIEHIVPDLVAAMDGDPDTEPAS